MTWLLAAVQISWRCAWDSTMRMSLGTQGELPIPLSEPAGAGACSRRAASQGATLFLDADGLLISAINQCRLISCHRSGEEHPSTR